MATSAAPPLDSAIAVPEDQTDPRGKRLPKLTIGFEWIQYLTGLSGSIDKKPERAARVGLRGQGASLPTTPIPMAVVSAGIWRVSYTVRITRPASGTSSLQVTVSWTDGAIAQSQTAAAITGNTVTTNQFGTLILRVDAATPISYSTTYASVGGTPMEYEIDVVAEQLALN